MLVGYWMYAWARVLLIFKTLLNGFMCAMDKNLFVTVLPTTFEIWTGQSRSWILFYWTILCRARFTRYAVRWDVGEDRGWGTKVAGICWPHHLFWRRAKKKKIVICESNNRILRYYIVGVYLYGKIYWPWNDMRK